MTAPRPPVAGWDEFPRQYARTRRFSLGAPRSFAVGDDGSRVAFLRSRDGADPVGCLWVLDVASGEQRCVADPRALGHAAIEAAALPPEERARRERARESAGGIVAYAADPALTHAVFALAADAYTVDLRDGGEPNRLPVDGPVIGPRLDRGAARVAFVRAGALHVVDRDGGSERRLAGDDDDDVTWGLPDFVAAEEMGRLRGFWWSPDGRRLAVSRVDTSPVQRWSLSEPADPQRPATVLAYPAAGTANATVSLHVVDLAGDRVVVDWDAEAMPYLVDVVWSPHGPLTVVVQARDQRLVRVLGVDPASGATTVLSEQRDAAWVELGAGVPRWLPGGRLVTTVDDADTRRLAVDGEAVTPPGLQVRRLVSADTAGLTFTAWGDDPTAVAVWTLPLDGSGPRRLTPADGMADAAASAGVTVLVTAELDQPGATVTVDSAAGQTPVTSFAERPLLTPNVRIARLGERMLPAALLLPSGCNPDEPTDGAPLPVLLDPYGGPSAQRVVRSGNAHVASQWFADAGFAVLVVDGRGTPGRGPAWERTVAGDLATAPLDDQVDALHACAAAHPGLLDLERVAIRGWSFGGYLAALAVLRRPDVFAAAIAGAPVTDWTLYDTHYTERYLGLPTDRPDAYRRSSLLDDAASLRRPLLLIHGMADDNVVAAHTLRLSRALLEAGRAHTVLPLSGVTHMTPQETVAENLLRLQLDFLRDTLGASRQ